MKVFRVCRVLNPDYKVFSIFEEFLLKSEIYVSLKEIKKIYLPVMKFTDITFSNVEHSRFLGFLCLIYVAIYKPHDRLLLIQDMDLPNWEIVS